MIRKQVDDDGDGIFDRGEAYVYDGADVVLAFDETSSLTNRYLHGDAVDQVFASEDALGEILWALTDNQGTVRDVVDYDEPTDTTSIANHLQFDAFGNITSETDPNVDFCYAYTGRFFDWDTHLQYNRARWYDAVVALWLSEDPIGFAAGDANLGRYVGNAAPNATDPDGLESKLDSLLRWFGGQAGANNRVDRALEIGNGVGRGALDSLSMGAFGKVQDAAAAHGNGTFRFNKTAAKVSETVVDVIQMKPKGAIKECIELGVKKGGKRQVAKQAAKKGAKKGTAKQTSRKTQDQLRKEAADAAEAVAKRKSGKQAAKCADEVATGVKLSPRARKKLGNLIDIKDKDAAKATLDRGGTASNVRKALGNKLRGNTVGEIGNLAAQGDKAAESALKIIKRASKCGQR